MKHFIAFFSLLIISVSLFGQNLNFQFSRPLLHKFDSIERSLGGIQKEYNYTISIDSNYFPNTYLFDLENPKVFLQKNGRIVLETSCYYSKQDSIVRLIEYNWDFTQKLTKQLKNTFNKNQKNITKQLNRKGLYLKEEMGTPNNIWTRESVIWENENSFVRLFKINGQGTYRVRVLISYK